MHRHFRSLLGTALFLTASTAALAAGSRPDPAPPLATAVLATASGSAVGSATITVPRTGSPVLQVRVSGLSSGVHGIHLHAVGKCDPPKFTSAGGHLNPHGREHGKLNPAGSHLGDLPNLTIGADGAGGLTHVFGSDADTLRAHLFDADGTALVIHAKPDDYRTDPAGDAGDRIVCGVLVR
jgi:Cu-Zn family superoxide dismutase